MRCTKCESYSWKLGRCRLGLINPKTIKGGAEAARLLGLGSICRLCEIREKIVAALEKERGEAK